MIASIYEIKVLFIDFFSSLTSTPAWELLHDEKKCCLFRRLCDFSKESTYIETTDYGHPMKVFFFEYPKYYGRLDRLAK